MRSRLPRSSERIRTSGATNDYRRRAQLLLLGLEPSIEESTSDSGRWFRVVIGPFATRAQMNRVRGLTAQQNIDTLQLKRRSP